MITHIKSYIQKNNSVSIHGLGTLELIYKNAEIHPICQDFTPPGKYLFFEANENEEGEAFTNYVSETMNLGIDEAKRLIDQWVNEVNQAMQTEGKYVLGSMGCFVRGNVGMTFEPVLDSELSSDSFGLKVFSLREERKDLFEKKEEKVCPKDTIIKNGKFTQTMEEEAKEKIAEEIKEPKSEVKKEEAPVEIEPIEEVVEEKNEAETSQNVEESSYVPSEKPKKHVGKIIFYTLLIFLLCVIIFVGVYAILRPNDFVQKKDSCVLYVTSLFNKESPQEEEVTSSEIEDDDWYMESTEDQPLVDEISIEPVQDEVLSTEFEGGKSVAKDQVTKQPKVKETTSTSVKPAKVEKTARCYVIIGGFGNPANADNLVRSMKSKYPNTCNLGLNAKGTLTMVGIGPYTRQEAENQSKALSSVYKDCWIFEK